MKQKQRGSWGESVCDRDTRQTNTLYKPETKEEEETKGLTETIHRLPERAVGL